MKVTDFIVILLFIIPGVIAEKISSSMDLPSSRKRSEFQDVVVGIILSLPIVGISGLIMCFIYWDWNISSLYCRFDSVQFLVIFTIISLLFALVFGVTKGLSNDWFTKKVNTIREKNEKIEIDSKSCWRKLFLDDAESHYVEVIINTQSLSGFTKWYSLPNEDKEIVLHEPESLEHYPDYKKLFKKIAFTYVNIEKNIVIKDYDMTEYNNWIDAGCPSLFDDTTF